MQIFSIGSLGTLGAFEGYAAKDRINALVEIDVKNFPKRILLFPCLHLFIHHAATLTDLLRRQVLGGEINYVGLKVWDFPQVNSSLWRCVFSSWLTF